MTHCQLCTFVGGWSELGVAEVEAGGTVECLFRRASDGACGQDRVFADITAECEQPPSTG